LAASMHLVAAVGNAQSFAEVDANPNPLREEVAAFVINNGRVTLSTAPGMGVEPDLRRLARFMV